MAKGSTKSIWGEHEIPLNKSKNWSIGDIHLWCKRTKDEIQIAYSKTSADNSTATEQIELPENVSWSRWALKKEYPSVKFTPLFPDRPVVVKPESPFKLNKGVQARVYIRVPIWIKITQTTRETIELFEIPTVVLSNTWFGSFAEGELCYWISSGVRREIEPDPTRPYLAICPIQLMNQSESDLIVEKICLRVSNLSLFFDKKQLWADDTKVTYKGEQATSQIEFTGKPPAEAGIVELISSPRNPIKKSLVAQTFASLKDLPGIGILMN